jgi:hypothetical protein
MKVLNAFSLQMIEGLGETTIDFAPITEKAAKKIIDICKVESYIGHQDFATVLTNTLGKEIPFNRANAKLERGELALVCQLSGGRLPEGCTTLPENISIKYYLIEVNYAVEY